MTAAADEAQAASEPGMQKASQDPEAPVADKRRVLLCGDTEGSLVKLFSQVQGQQKRVGAFDVLFAVGAFLPPIGAPSAAEGLKEYVTGARKAPIDTYFIESQSAAMISAAAEGKQMCDRVHFLGGFGIRCVAGLRVAFLSGRYDPTVYSGAVRGAPGPAFVGKAYTPQAIDGLIALARENAEPIDVLLTAEWPLGLEGKMDPADAPKCPDNEPLNWQEMASPAVAELVTALEPRYHACATGNFFYARPPFQTQRSGHVCRVIALGKVGSKGKERLWIKGLALSPAKTMTQEVLKHRPDDTTPCPFVSAARGAADGNRGVKRCADDMIGGAIDGEDGDGTTLCDDQVYLQGLPTNIDEKRLQKALKHVGEITRLHLAREDGDGRPCKGFGWVTFSSPEEAQAACDLSGMLECGGRQIKISLARSRAKSGGPGGKREVKIMIEPHQDCWFCLVNPKVERHMIVSATSEVYVATARGPVMPSHVLVLPVKHAPCYLACPPELQDAFQSHVQALRAMWDDAGHDLFIWERWIPMSVSAANHMQIQIVPIDRSVAGRARDALQECFKRSMPKAALTRIASHKEVSQHVGDDPETPYVYFEIPGDNSAKGRVVERYVYAGVDGEGPRIPIDLGRRVACHLLGLEDRVDWRGCTDDKDVEKDLAATFRKQFIPFQPSKNKS